MENGKIIKKTEGGFIALTSVLIIGAVIIVLGVSIFYASLTDQSISTAYQSGQEAAFLADFCLKEGVLRLGEDINYKGGEEIEVGDATCYIGLVEDIDENTKKVSSLGKAGERPHFSRVHQLVRYVIESSREDWEKGNLENLTTAGDSLTLKTVQAETILNSASEESCDTLCQIAVAGSRCVSIGTNYPDASNTEVKFCE